MSARGLFPWARLSPDVLVARRSTRAHALEEHARPSKCSGTARKSSFVDSRPRAATFPCSQMLRLNLSRWLINSDDPMGSGLRGSERRAGLFGFGAASLQREHYLSSYASRRAPAVA